MSDTQINQHLEVIVHLLTKACSRHLKMNQAIHTNDMILPVDTTTRDNQRSGPHSSVDNG